METGYGERKVNTSGSFSSVSSGSSSVQTAAAVSRGMVVGNAISGDFASDAAELDIDLGV